MDTQRTIDFDSRTNTEAAHVAELTSEPPPPDSVRRVPPLVRPDRQIIYVDALSSYEWPDASTLRDRDTISVDRIRDDIDGPAHRFVIKRLDQVEVFFSAHRTETGEVVGISHAHEQVCVKFPGAAEGIWFAKGQIYPVADDEPQPKAGGQTLAEVIVKVNSSHGSGLTEAHRVPEAVHACRSYSFDDFKTFHRRNSAEPVTLEDYQAEFERIWDSQEKLKIELVARFNAKELAVLAARMGSSRARGATKGDNAASIVQSMLSYFVLDGVVQYSPLQGGGYEEAIRKKVLGLTAGEYHRHFEKQQEAALAHEQALTDPETFQEFRTFITEQGEEKLNDEQLARYDALHADITRERRRKETPTSVAKFESAELQGIGFELKTGFHDILDALKDQCLGIELVAIERNYTLSDVLSAKGHEVQFGDFLEHQGSYDRIVMNPPFEYGQDMEHIRHAFSLLSPGGRLVSVVCEGPFFRSDKHSVAFREWLDEIARESEQLPDDAFQGRDAFRETSVRTRLLTLTKNV
jgi:hypothetical protein